MGKQLFTTIKLLISKLENLYVLKNCSFDFSLNVFYYCYNCTLLNHQVSIFKKAVTIFISNSASFTFLSSCLYLHITL